LFGEGGGKAILLVKFAALMLQIVQHLSYAIFRDLAVVFVLVYLYFMVQVVLDAAEV
jgi:hypothetical protein